MPTSKWIRSGASLLLVVAIAGRQAFSQSGINSWGELVFDSRWNDGPYRQIAAGTQFTIAVRTDGTAVMWGENLFPNKLCHPPQLPPGVAYVQAAAANDHAVALRSDGNVVAWGYNESGQCNVPDLPRGLTYVEVDAGGMYDSITSRSDSIARRSDGSVIAWGDNRYGQCDIPLLPRGLTYVEIAAGPTHNVARRSDGSVIAWGENHSGQCDVPPLPQGLTYVEIAAGGRADYYSDDGEAVGFSLARRSDGSVVAWGDNTQGQCNVPPLPAGLAYVQIAAGGAHAAAVRSDGAVVAWGANAEGQCDVPPLPGSLTYVEVAAGRGGFTESGGHTVARRSDGSVVCWGENSVAQCNIPALPPGVTYTQIDSFESSIAALRSDGQIFVLSYFPEQRAVPPLPSGLTYVEVNVGGTHCVARRSDGSVVAWGSNSDGQCSVPPLPPGLTYVEVDAADKHSVARRSDGSVVAWGQNTLGQCNVPALPRGLTYVEIAAGGSFWDDGEHTLARRSDGSVVAFGNNDYGQCHVPALPPGLTYIGIAAASYDNAFLRSDGSIVSYDTPALPPGTRYTRVAAGYQHFAAIRNDGVAVAWGAFDNYGQYSVPELPPGLRYVEVAPGYSHTVGRFEGCATCEPAFCLGDGGARSAPCPCSNLGATGHGCENSASTGGGTLHVQGSVEPDQVELVAREEPEAALTIFVQGRSILASPLAQGEGARCIGGALKRLGAKTASGGSAAYPEPGDVAIRTRSRSLGDPIASGTFRYYQAFYRDSASRMCSPAGSTMNTSNAVTVAW